jgi:hypothetical protein
MHRIAVVLSSSEHESSSRIDRISIYCLWSRSVVAGRMDVRRTWSRGRKRLISRGRLVRNVRIVLGMCSWFRELESGSKNWFWPEPHFKVRLRTNHLNLIRLLHFYIGLGFRSCTWDIEAKQISDKTQFIPQSTFPPPFLFLQPLAPPVRIMEHSLFRICLRLGSNTPELISLTDQVPYKQLDW